MARWADIIRLFRSDERGNIVMLFGLTLVPVVGAAGVAIDYSTASNMKTALQVEVDAAALEAAKIAVDVRTDAAYSKKTMAQKEVIFEAQIAAALASRREIARARPSISELDFALTGSWVDANKSLYRVTANANVNRYFRVLNSGAYTPVASSATAWLDYNPLPKTPTMISPGYDAGDYNRIYAYCYNKSEPVVANRRTKMTAVTSNGVYSGGSNSGKKEIEVADVFKTVVIPTCDPEKGETLSWRLYNVRDSRTTQSRWPTDTYNSSTKLWTASDSTSSFLNSTGTPQQRTLFNYHSDTTTNEAGVESYQFDGSQLGYNAPIDLMETAVCDTADKCNPYKPNSDVGFGTNRVPGKASVGCSPGKFMYIGFEDRPYIPGRTSAEYSTWGSGFWTDRDYEDVTFVVSCPDLEWTKKIKLVN
jgi:Flp pilus assembly protein TadG